MTREQLLLALQVDYGALATQLGITDLTSDYSPFAAAADRAARLLGLAATSRLDEAAQAALDESHWQDVAEVYVLRALQTACTGSVDVRVQNSSASAVQKSYSQLAKQVGTLLATAEQSRGWRAYGTQDFTMGYIQLDYLEPAPAEFG